MNGAEQVDRVAGPAGPPADGAWVERAACRGEDLDLFYSQDPDDELRALAVCATCPVREACLDHAMVARETFGVWGGTREAERRRIFRRERRRRAEERRPAA